MVFHAVWSKVLKIALTTYSRRSISSKSIPFKPRSKFNKDTLPTLSHILTKIQNQQNLQTYLVKKHQF